jgi:hypothetical protein
VYSPPGSFDSQVYSSPGSHKFDSPLYSLLGSRDFLLYSTQAIIDSPGVFITGESKIHLTGAFNTRKSRFHGEFTTMESRFPGVFTTAELFSQF